MKRKNKAEKTYCILRKLKLYLKLNWLNGNVLLSSLPCEMKEARVHFCWQSNQNYFKKLHKADYYNTSKMSLLCHFHEQIMPFIDLSIPSFWSLKSIVYNGMNSRWNRQIIKSDIKKSHELFYDYFILEKHIIWQTGRPSKDFVDRVVPKFQMFKGSEEKKKIKHSVLQSRTCKRVFQRTMALRIPGLVRTQCYAQI